MPICFIDQHKLVLARGLGEHDASEQDKKFSLQPLAGDCDAKHEVGVFN